MNYEDYEQECKLIRQENEELLKIFADSLAGLKQNTVDKHLFNVDFYINEFLLRMEAIHAADGYSMISEFLGYFYIRKCMWSTPASIKTTAASIKKFYKCLLDHKLIAKEAYKELCSEIKENMEEWQDDCARFNDPDGDYFDFF